MSWSQKKWHQRSVMVCNIKKPLCSDQSNWPKYFFPHLTERVTLNRNHHFIHTNLNTQTDNNTNIHKLAETHTQAQRNTQIKGTQTHTPTHKLIETLAVAYESSTHAHTSHTPNLPSSKLQITTKKTELSTNFLYKSHLREISQNQRKHFIFF